MVDALRETGRVLTASGVMVDLRPIATDAPIDVVGPEGECRVGSVDGSPGVADDMASDAAIDTVVGEGRFQLRNKLHFQFYYYWDGVDEMAADFENNWQRRHCNPTATVLSAARRKLNARGADARLRTRLHMMLAT